MVRTFKDRETEKIFNREYSKKLPTDIQEIALRKLRMLNRSINLNDLRILPANRLDRRFKYTRFLCIFETLKDTHPALPD